MGSGDFVLYNRSLRTFCDTDRHMAIQETAWCLPWQSVQALIQMFHWVSICYKPEITRDNQLFWLMSPLLLSVLKKPNVKTTCSKRGREQNGWKMKAGGREEKKERE